MTSGSASRLRPISEDQEIPEPSPSATAAPGRTETNVATGLLLLALKALSQRAVVALDGLFTLACVASAFALWYVTLPQPTPGQLTGLGLYGLLLIAIHLVRRK